MRIPLVQEHGLARAHGQFELATHGTELRLPWREVAEVVEAALTDGHHRRVGSQFRKGFKGRVVKVRGMVRMNAAGGEEAVRKTAMQLDGGTGGLDAGAGDDEASYPGIGRALHDLMDIVAEAFVAEVGSDVDKVAARVCWYHLRVDHCARIADNAPQAGQLALWGASAAMPRVRRSSRARRIAVRILADGAVELVVPQGVAERRAYAFLESRRAWVEQQVQRRQAMLATQEPFPPSVLDLPAIGEQWRLHLGAGTGRARVVEAGEGWLSLRGQGSGDFRRALRSWLVARAGQAFAPRLAALACEFGFTYSRLQVRTQRSRWGSCSTRGTISLNLALLFQPPEVLRYLMCHELAHTRHMNHSGAFWRCVEACEPQWRRLDRLLGQGWQHVPQWLLQPVSE